MSASLSLISSESAPCNIAKMQVRLDFAALFEPKNPHTPIIYMKRQDIRDRPIIIRVGFI